MRAVLPIFAFLAAFLAVNRFVVARVPLPPEAGLRTKVRFAEEHLADYDAFFIGSSATLYGLRPDVFVTVMAERGYPGMRVLNLGVGGMGSFEGAVILRRVLKHASERLAWVFYEEPLFDALLWYPDVVNPRYIHWHDVPATIDAIDALEFAAAPPDYKREAYEAHWSGSWRRAVAWEHIELCARRETALSEGANIASALLGRDDAWPTLREISLDDGWMDIALDPDPGAQRVNERFLADRAAWESRLQALRDAESVRPPIEGNYDVDSLRSLLAGIRAAGAEPVVYVAPRGTPSPMMNSLEDAGEIDTLFQFNAPTRYPELDDPALRWDANHLNEKGAIAWTRLFAARFADHLDDTGSSATRKR